MTTDLRHHSATPITLDALELREQTSEYKPRGLWVSVGAEWQDWCNSEQYATETLVNQYQVTLAANASMLIVDSAEALDAFTDQYSAPASWSPMSTVIDWPAVAAIHDGILISPYQWSRRHDRRTFWYYGWDIASGCIWNPAAIESLTIRETATTGSEN